MKRFFGLAFCIILIILCCSCYDKTKEPYKEEIFAMDTVITITVYGEEPQEKIAAASREIKRLEALFSVTNESSDISGINKNSGEFVKVSDDTVALLKTAVEASELTDGAIDISVYPVVKLWGFTTGEYKVPDDKHITNKRNFVDYKKIIIDEKNSSVKIEKGMELDLGAVAKGYTSQKIKNILNEMGNTSAIINLGGNIETVGKKPDEDPWTIGIQYPNDSNYFSTLELGETSIITSGGYQRNFEENGIVYHHIIDPSTGKPADSGIVSSTVVCDNSAMGDALSTALFVMGKDKSIDLYRKYNNFEFILLDENDKVYVSKGIKDSFSLSQGYKDLEVCIVE